MNPLKYIRNEHGVALMVVMLLATICLTIMSSLLYMVTVGTKMSGMSKRYATALEAGKGAEGVMMDYVNNRGNMSTAFKGALILNVAISGACEQDKMNSSTAEWDPACDQSVEIDVTDSSTYDLKFPIGDYPDGVYYDVYAKIVDTVEGNTASASADVYVQSGVVKANAGEVATPPIAGIYTIEIDARNPRNPEEKARLSLLYQN